MFSNYLRVAGWVLLLRTIFVEAQEDLDMKESDFPFDVPSDVPYAVPPSTPTTSTSPTVGVSGSPTVGASDSPTFGVVQGDTSTPTTRPTIGGLQVGTAAPSTRPTIGGLQVGTIAPSVGPTNLSILQADTSIPTSVPDTLPVKELQVAPENCNIQTCTFFNSLLEIRKLLQKTDAGSQQLCACPFDFSVENGKCTGTPVDDTIRVRNGQDVTFACASGESCRISCPHTLMDIEAGGAGHLQNLELTGGNSETRIFVGTGGLFFGKLLNITSTSALFNFQNRRRVQVGNSINTKQQVLAGNGGGVANFGSARLESCNFEFCQASNEGGAIYHRGLDATIVNCTFQGNLAAEGGAISVGGEGRLIVDLSTFSNNIAVVRGRNLFQSGESTELRGCENQGLDGIDLSCDPFSESSSVPPTLATSPWLTLLMAGLVWRFYR